MAQDVRKPVIIDAEMENTGADAIADNRRVISVQIGDSARQDLYYADASVGERGLFQVAIRVRMLVSQGYLFAGYNIKELEVPFLRRFLGVTIPEANVLDLRDMEGVKKLQLKTGKSTLELDEVCGEYGIAADHKRPMAEKADLIKKKPEIVAQANEAAQQLVAKGLDPGSAQKHALDRIAMGHAILEAYDEFVQRNGAADTLFHRYAVGDVVYEHRLLQALQQPTAPRPANPRA